MTIEAYEKGLLFRNGRFVRVLEPGRHRLGSIWVTDRIVRVDMRDRTMTLAGREMITADPGTLRAQVVARWRVADPVAAVLKSKDYVQELRAQLELAVVAALAVRTLDGLLNGRPVLGAREIDALRLDLETYGLALLDVGVTRLEVPREVRRALASRFIRNRA